MSIIEIVELGILSLALIISVIALLISGRARKDTSFYKRVENFSHIETTPEMFESSLKFTK